MNALPVMYGRIVVGAPAIFCTSSGRMPWRTPARRLPAGGGVVAAAGAGADAGRVEVDLLAHPSPRIPISSPQHASPIERRITYLPPAEAIRRAAGSLRDASRAVEAGTTRRRGADRRGQDAAALRRRCPP